MKHHGEGSNFKITIISMQLMPFNMFNGTNSANFKVSKIEASFLRSIIFHKLRFKGTLHTCHLRTFSIIDQIVVLTLVEVFMLLTDSEKNASLY